MTGQELLASLASMSPSQLGSLDHAALYMARYGASPAQQAEIAPYEHRAFAREAVAENPLMALPIAAGTLAYQPYKVLTGQSRSPANLDQIRQGMTGVGEGLWQALQRIGR